MKDWEIALLVGGGLILAGVGAYLLIPSVRGTPSVVTFPSPSNPAPQSVANSALSYANTAVTLANGIGSAVSGSDWNVGDAVNDIFS